MKNNKLILPLILVAIVVAAAFIAKPVNHNENKAGERVVSENGKAELIDFFKALSQKNYTHAAQYVKEDCKDRCLIKNATKEQIPIKLEELCKTNICEPIEYNELVDFNKEEVNLQNAEIHKVHFINKDGSERAICVDKECKIKLNRFNVRMMEIDGMWYVSDEIPLDVSVQ